MGETFKKLKKQHLISAIIKSAIGGASFGLLVTGIVLLALKLAKVQINPAFYVLIAVGCTLALGGGLFLLLRPTDVKIAKKLDKEYGLNEKVQTMVEFSESEGEVIKLQREDAEVKLSTLPKRKPSVSKLWQYVAAPVVAVALLFTAVFIPMKTVGSASGDEFDFSNVQAIALRQLIDDVKKSALDETLSGQTVVVLEGLLDGLDETKHESVMRRAVLSSITLIDGIFENANSYADIAAELSKSERSEKFSSSITTAVTSYKSPVKITTLQKVNDNAAKGDANISAALEESVNPLMEEFNALRGNALDSAIRLFLASFNANLVNSGYGGEDELYGVLDSFSKALLDVADKIVNGGYSTSNIQAQIKSACANYVQSGTLALSEQMYNCMMDEFVREKLAEIFGIKSSDLPNKGPNLPQQSGGTDTPNPDKDPEETPGGGHGPGGVQHGSNDLIYDPDKEQKVEYGEVFNKYYAEAVERLASGEISDELIKFISEYFKNLDLVNRNEDENK